MLASKLLMTVGGEEKLWVDDCFSTWTYTGNGSTQTITNGIDLAGKGGMVWIKNRTFSPSDHNLYDTVRGTDNLLRTNQTTAQVNVPQPYEFTSFNPDGFSVGQLYANPYGINKSGDAQVAWTFRNAKDFFQVLQVTKSTGSNLVIDLSPYMTTPGMVKVKRTDAAGSWYVWHRSLSAGQLLIGESTAAAATLGQITVVGTTLTLVNGVIADGTYHVECYAHDTSADGLIQCGSYYAENANPTVKVNLGFEPQFILIKGASGAGSANNWAMFDVSRGMPTGSTAEKLIPNTPAAATIDRIVYPTATGFNVESFGNGDVNFNATTYIYCVIRRSNKPPTLGTQVYNAIARISTNSPVTVSGVGFAPDFLLSCHTGNLAALGIYDRLRGVPKYLKSNTTAAEITGSDALLSFTMDGYSAGADATDGNINFGTRAYINHFFKRAVGVFDQVCYTGTGVAKTEAHGLGVVPELMIVKSRTDAFWWYACTPTMAAANTAVSLNSSNPTAGGADLWNATAPTVSVFSVGTSAVVSGSGSKLVAYLFATKAGISKVGNYTGNGASQTLDMGFTTGARFFLVKSTSTTGNWWVFDSTRGIVSSTDFALALNSTAAEVTSADAVDPHISGIIVNQEATCSLNATGISYIYLAYA